MSHQQHLEADWQALQAAWENGTGRDLYCLGWGPFKGVYKDY